MSMEKSSDILFAKLERWHTRQIRYAYACAFFIGAFLCTPIYGMQDFILLMTMGLSAVFISIGFYMLFIIFKMDRAKKLEKAMGCLETFTFYRNSRGQHGGI